MKETEQQATLGDIKAMKRECWSPNCKNRAWLRDWCGWQWCFKHWYFSMRWGGGNKWFFTKTTRPF